MGVDAEVFCRAKQPLTDKEVARLGYELGAAIGPDHFLSNVAGTYGKAHGPISIEQENDWEVPGDGQLLNVHMFMRYYGPGYERGSWPIIRMTLEFLRAKDLTVYYFGNSGGCGERCEVTDEGIREMDAHWMASGGRPYRDGFGSFRSSKAPTCRVCLEPLTNSGGGGSDDYWTCQGCGYQAITDGEGKEHPLERYEEFFKAHERIRKARSGGVS